MNPGGARRVGLVQRVGERINMDGYLAGGAALAARRGGACEGHRAPVRS